MENAYIIGAIMLIVTLLSLFISGVIDDSHNERIAEDIYPSNNKYIF